MQRLPHFFLFAATALLLTHGLGCSNAPPGPDSAADPANQTPAVVDVPTAPAQPDPAPNQPETPPDDPFLADDAESPARQRRTELSALIEVLESAEYKLQTDDRPGSIDDDRKAGQLAAQFEERYSDLSRQERRICSIAAYFLARGLAQGGELPAALTALQHATDLGFNDPEQIDRDDELAPLRESPEFASWRTAWGEQLLEATRNEIQDKLAAFEPYPISFQLPNLDSQDVQLADYRGQVVVVNFWGTWCIQCRAEIPSLVALQTRFGKDGLQILGLAYEETDDSATAAERVREFLAEHPVNYPCLLGDEATRDQIRPPDDSPPEWVFPTTLFLDRQGRVRLHFAGAMTQAQLDAAAAVLLQEDRPDAPAAP